MFSLQIYHSFLTLTSLIKNSIRPSYCIQRICEYYSHFTFDLTSPHSITLWKVLCLHLVQSFPLNWPNETNSFSKLWSIKCLLHLCSPSLVKYSVVINAARYWDKLICNAAFFFLYPMIYGSLKLLQARESDSDFPTFNRARHSCTTLCSWACQNFLDCRVAG